MAGMAWALEKRHALIRARWSRQRDRAREAHRALQCAAAAASHSKQCSRPACIYLQPRDAAPFPSAAAAAAAAPMLQHGAALCRCMSVPAFSMGVKILHIWVVMRHSFAWNRLFSHGLCYVRRLMRSGEH